MITTSKPLEDRVNQLPCYWSQSMGGEGGTLLTYAVRGGRRQSAVKALGVLLVLAGAWAIYWLLSGGDDLTLAGAVLLIVPAGVTLLGVHCLDITLRAHTEILIGRHSLSIRRHALFGASVTDIPRRDIVEIAQQYSPPATNAGLISPGEWVTIVAFQQTTGGQATEQAIDGLHTSEEARWLGPLLANWAEVPLRRGFGAGLEEAEGENMPNLD